MSSLLERLSALDAMIPFMLLIVCMTTVTSLALYFGEDSWRWVWMLTQILCFVVIETKVIMGSFVVPRKRLTDGTEPSRVPSPGLPPGY
jgi:membrane protein YdbS with pleckstrin-like domain